MIDKQELPIGFTMELAEHLDVLRKFSALPEEAQQAYIDGASRVNSREEMRSYVENMFEVQGMQ